MESLVQRCAQGDIGAWQELQATLEPEILAMSRRHRLLRNKGLASLPDDLAQIKLATFERLSRDGFANLKRFLERRQSGAAANAESFDAWLYGAVDFVIREHVRARFGRAPKPTSDGDARVRLSKRDLHSHAGRLDEQVERGFLRTLGMTARLTAAEILACVEREFAPNEALALRLYYGEDRDFHELARALDLEDAKAAERLIRKLNARLRYRFAREGDGEE